MGIAEISQKVASIRDEINGMLAQDDLEPCIRSGLESAQAHVQLLCIELGLDVQ